MNSRRPKIWLTEDEILAAIDLTRRKAKRLAAEETELLRECSELFGELENTRFELMKSDLTKGQRGKLESRERYIEIDASKKKAEAEKLSKAHTRIIEKTLPRLGQALASFRTQTMDSILGDYRGVAIR